MMGTHVVDGLMLLDASVVLFGQSYGIVHCVNYERGTLIAQHTVSVAFGCM
jgi:hypothetical protein